LNGTELKVLSFQSGAPSAIVADFVCCEGLRKRREIYDRAAFQSNQMENVKECYVLSGFSGVVEGGMCVRFEENVNCQDETFKHILAVTF
jgi:hypothetical protein